MPGKAVSEERPNIVNSGRVARLTLIEYLQEHLAEKAVPVRKRSVEIPKQHAIVFHGRYVP